MIENFSRLYTNSESLENTATVPATNFNLSELYEGFRSFNFRPPSETEEEEEEYSNYQASSMFINEILVLPDCNLFDSALTATTNTSATATNNVSSADDSEEEEYATPADPPDQLFAPHADDAPYAEHPLDRRHCRHLTPEQRVARNPAAIRRLSREQIQSISGLEIASIAPLLSPEQVVSLSRDQIRTLPILNMNMLLSMSRDQLSALTPQQMLNVRYMLPSLPVSIISAFTPAQLGNASASRAAAEQQEAQRLRSIQRNALFGHQGVYT